MSKKVGILVVNGSEDVELFTPIDILNRAGAQVFVLSCNPKEQDDTPHIFTKSNIKVICDESLYQNESKVLEIVNNLDCVIIPGGQILEDFYGDKPIEQIPQSLDKVRSILVEKAQDKNFLFGSICVSTGGVLEHWGVIDPKKYRYTGYPGTSKNITGAPYEISLPDNSAALVSANSPSSAMVFSLFLVSILYDTNKSDQIANDILFFDNSHT
ncbi:MAG: DJ-1/PfpI family protein [Bifidobacteriaceae bacterium]|jgi:4-methyl-5(b-hydroxyethyl)-thiazole monophosphate biosynthesis|nr:DJ-1/PfpI family protein [Bifidobacteriaceae bacterium]